MKRRHRRRRFETVEMECTAAFVVLDVAVHRGSGSVVWAVEGEFIDWALFGRATVQLRLIQVSEFP